MEFTSYIDPELLVLIPALYGMGMVIKSSEKISNNYIPLIITAAALALSCLYVLGTDGVTPVSIFTAIVQGFICAAGAVYTNELIKHVK